MLKPRFGGFLGFFLAGSDHIEAHVILEGHALKGRKILLCCGKEPGAWLWEHPGMIEEFYELEGDRGALGDRPEDQSLFTDGQALKGMEIMVENFSVEASAVGQLEKIAGIPGSLGKPDAVSVLDEHLFVNNGEARALAGKFGLSQPSIIFDFIDGRAYLGLCSDWRTGDALHRNEGHHQRSRDVELFGVVHSGKCKHFPSVVKSNVPRGTRSGLAVLTCIAAYARAFPPV